MGGQRGGCLVCRPLCVASSSERLSERRSSDSSADESEFVLMPTLPFQSLLLSLERSTHAHFLRRMEMPKQRSKKKKDVCVNPERKCYF